MKKVTHAGANRETRMKLFYLERELQHRPPWRSKAEEIVDGANAFVPNLPILWLNISAVSASDGLGQRTLKPRAPTPRRLAKPFRTEHDMKRFLTTFWA